MKYLIPLLLLLSVSQAKAFKLGECVHAGREVYKITVIGTYSYGMQVQNDLSNTHVFLLPIQDLDKLGVKSDCLDVMQKKHNAYLKSLEQ